MSRDRNVPINKNNNVPILELVHSIPTRKRTSKKNVEDIAVDKWNNCGEGIDYKDLIKKFGLSKPKAQRILKDSCNKRIDKAGEKRPQILFRADPMVFPTLKRTNPQKYFPNCIKADIIECLKKRKSVPIQDTVPNLISNGLHHPPSSKYPLYDAIECQKAQSFLDVLSLLHFQPAHIHKLQLKISINPTEYANISGERYNDNNRGKIHRERIGRVSECVCLCQIF